MGLAETAHLVTQLDLRDGLTPGLGRASGAVSGFAGKVGVDFGRVGTGAKQVGQGLARVGMIAGGVFVAGMAGAAKAAIDYEDAFAGVRKTVEATPEELETMSRAFRDLATEIPITAVEFARLGEAAGALGIAKGDIVEFSRVTALMGVTTNLSADEAADSFGRIGTILKLTGKEYEQLADSIVNLGNKGASTESEIVEIMKRFAAEGKAAGLLKEQIAGLASATASLGFAPERGGTALSRVFANMATNISVANEKGLTFAELTGKSIGRLQRDLDKGRGLSIFLDTLKALGGMSATEASRTLLYLGVTNASDRNIFRVMSQNLPFINDQLQVAADSTSALTEEANKRFDTVRSKFQLLRQNIVEAGITIGEGFAPALGRAAQRLTAWIKANKDELRSLGADIGKALDGIDWGRVMDGAKALVGLFRAGWDIIRQIPPEITAIAGGLFGLNKLSGGLLGAGVGNIVGGLVGNAGRGALSRVPGLGRIAAQPVYVINWPMGGLGGAGGAAGEGVVAGGGGGVRGLLRTGLRLGAGLGIGLGAQMLGDALGGQLGMMTSDMGTIAGAFVAGGPVVGALAAITIGIGRVGDLMGQIGDAQASNREKAEELKNADLSKITTDLTNMTRLLREVQGADRVTVDTFASSELGSALRNAADVVLAQARTTPEISRGISQLIEAQQQAREHGWTDVADYLGTRIEALRRKTPSAAQVGAEVAKATASEESGGKARRSEMRDVIKHLRNITDDKRGKDYGFGRVGDRLAQRVQRALKATGDKSDRIVTRVIRDLEREQKRAQNAGATKLARNLGRDIERLKRQQHSDQSTGNRRLQTIANKDTTVKVTVPVTTSVSIRDVTQRTSTYSRYGYSAV